MVGRLGDGLEHVSPLVVENLSTCSDVFGSEVLGLAVELVVAVHQPRGARS